MLDFRGSGLEKWMVLELGPQLAGDGNLATYLLPFEFRALEAILQHRVRKKPLLYYNLAILDFFHITKYFFIDIWVCCRLVWFKTPFLYLSCCFSSVCILYFFYIVVKSCFVPCLYG